MEDKNNTHCENEHQRLIIIIAALFAIAGIFLLYAVWPALTGTDILLETKPLNQPLEIAPEKYITIQYEINTIPAISDIKPGETIFVELEKNNRGFWGYKSASLYRPDGFYLTGRVISIDGNNMNVAYGIENYFIKDKPKTSVINLEVEVRVSRDGQTRIEELYFNGDEPLIEQN